MTRCRGYIGNDRGRCGRRGRASASSGFLVRASRTRTKACIPLVFGVFGASASATSAQIRNVSLTTGGLPHPAAPGMQRGREDQMKKLTPANYELTKAMVRARAPGRTRRFIPVEHLHDIPIKPYAFHAPSNKGMKRLKAKVTLPKITI
jgi:hypothetical protein